MPECVEVMEEVLRTLARGEAILPLRTMLQLPEGRGIFGLMPSHLSAPPALGLKAISVFPANDGTAFDSHQGLVILFSPERGNPIAIMDASSITAIRTAAVSAVATRALAREDAADLALVGSGVQARTHLEAMAVVRPLRRVRVWSPTRVRVEAFAKWAAEALGITVEISSGPEEAVRGASIVCTVTAASQPVIRGEWLSEGAHVNAVGSSDRTARELDAAAVARCRLLVDRIESTVNESGDFLMARAEGAIADDHIRGELGDVLLGKIPGRTSGEQITLFKSLGLAVEDLAAAHHVLRAAERANVGLTAELGGLRH
ncbi:MAG: ornithine cyclodeaminase family protein [Gemmatimonadales bacterium]|nr:ornithine cyclodeaminase family protein [Gemmatimonadales bacterium]